MEFQESDLQRIVIERLRDGTFRDAIDGVIEVQRIADIRDENTLPHFSIDHVVRTSVARAAVRVLDSLNYPNLLVGDRNISVSPGEVLRPDIICIDEDTETLVLFELKKSDQTGRQALTELLAYEQEIKNILPFLADYDTALVLISTEWSTLMDHAAAGAIAWSGKTLLCLNATVEPEACKFHVRVPNAWYVTGSVDLPPESLSCATICLYDYAVGSTASPFDDFPLDQRVLAAIEMIAREGDRIGSHGFAILWRDCAFDSQSPLNITLAVVSPFAFYKAMRDREILQEEAGGLVPKLDEFIAAGSISGHSKALMTLASSVKPLLSDIASPMIEGLTEWSSQEIDMRTRALPLLCDSWGLPGKFVRDYWSHPAVRKHKGHWLKPEIRDWHDPSVAIPLLSAFFVPKSFADGCIRCSDAFHLGIAIGLDVHFRRALKRSSGQLQLRLRCRILWGYFELKNLLEEVHLIERAAENISAPEKPFELHADPDFDNEENSQRLINWIADDFLRNEPVYVEAFKVGLNGAPLFDEAIEGSLGEVARDEFVKFIGADVCNLSDGILTNAKEAFDEETMDNLSYQIASRSFKDLGLSIETASVDSIHKASLALEQSKLGEFVPKLLSLGDVLLLPVFHDLGPVAPKRVDWEWLQQGIREMRARGEKYPAVQMLANGELATGPLGMPALQSMAEVKDMEKEVLFSDSSSGICLIVNTTWEALKAGEHFRVLNDDLSNPNTSTSPAE